ncbi:probable 28S ribosomal protein S26, mitochondrial [Bradysia coprophila]|uniref:probable 28S ribosomal protein S26, mitochondrial n=1 Tax=Bradysia coprophila TaxID=38358 RepID=UPI00187DBB2E|nr:probable 28S ribosomal protein S26, mitochondrial [Bradysia coprophila]
MFKSVIKPINSAVRSSISSNLASVQCVQYHRKPRWLPQAKSKIFRVPERRKQDEDEKAELQRLHNSYKTQVKAVRLYLIEEIKLKKASSTADHVVITPEEEAADMQHCIELNNAWNASIAELRNKRLEQQMIERQEVILQQLELKREREEEERRAAEEVVRLEKERSKTYILREDLDQAIEYALAHPVDYNFALNLNGDIFNGRVSTDNTKNTLATATN